MKIEVSGHVYVLKIVRTENLRPLLPLCTELKTIYLIYQIIVTVTNYDI